MDKPLASAVVLSYKREGNLRQIVDRLLSHDWVVQVIVAHNSTSYAGPSFSEDGKVQVLKSIENRFTYYRFQAMTWCKTNIVVTCDDDNNPRNWDAIRDRFAADPARITAALKAPGHINADKNARWGTAHEVLLGWGSMFDRRWIEPAFKPYINAHGRDEVLHRKADRIFSIMMNRRHNVMAADFDELPGATSGALYQRSDHYKLTDEARQRCLALLGNDSHDL